MSTDLTHNSRKAWQTIRKLSNDPTSTNPPCLVNANQVAHQLLVNARGTMPTNPKRPVLPTVEGIHSVVSAFSEEEYRKGIAALKYNKTAGHRRRTGGATKEPRTQSSQVVANNAQQMPYRELDPKALETIEEYRHIEARERLRFQRAIDLYPSYATHTSYINE